MYISRIGDTVRYLNEGKTDWLAVGAAAMALAGWVTLVIALWRLL
jgi:hypothetical protein